MPTRKPKPTSTQPSALSDVLNFVNSRLQTTTSKPTFDFDITPIGTAGVVERTKLKETNVKNKNNEDPLMNNPDLLGTIHK